MKISMNKIALISTMFITSIIVTVGAFITVDTSVFDEVQKYLTELYNTSLTNVGRGTFTALLADLNLISVYNKVIFVIGISALLAASASVVYMLRAIIKKTDFTIKLNNVIVWSVLFGITVIIMQWLQFMGLDAINGNKIISSYFGANKFSTVMSLTLASLTLVGFIATIALSFTTGQEVKPFGNVTLKTIGSKFRMS